ncbi:MAG: GatB/YqeY domain-containing protein [Deltaproteobacteria bacterium]|nr:GatB/YqeY domain-containing protein [Deltaproteobacteria bacterium]
MSLLEEIDEGFKKALKTQDKIRLSSLRMLRAALKNKEIERRGKLDDPEILSVIKGLIRQGKEAVDQFEKGGRLDLSEKEKTEIEIFSEFLPAQATPLEMEEIIGQIIPELKATGIKDMGKVMKAAVARLAGRAEGQTIQAIVKQKLSSL